MSLPVLAVVGASNSGKTTVACTLIRGLVERGHRIAAIKHTPHGHQVDRPGSDSARLLAAGAEKLLLSSPGMVTSMELTQADAPLQQAVASLGNGYDLVIAEGFKESGAPKVLVRNNGQSWPSLVGVFAVVGDGEPLPGVPTYSLHDLDGLMDQIQSELLTRTEEGPSVSLTVDGVPIALGGFTSGVLSEIVVGFLRALRDVPPSPRGVTIELRTVE